MFKHFPVEGLSTDAKLTASGFEVEFALGNSGHGTRGWQYNYEVMYTSIQFRIGSFPLKISD